MSSLLTFVLTELLRAQTLELVCLAQISALPLRSSVNLSRELGLS